jgi:hypothetical protein
MPVLRQRIGWTQQPQTAASVDWSNPITRGLVLVDSPSISKHRLANVNSASIAYGDKGCAFVGNAAATSYFWRQVNVAISSEASILAIVSGASGGVDRRSYSLASSVNNTPILSLQCGASDANISAFFARGMAQYTVSSSANYYSSGKPHIDVGVCDANSTKLYVNGTLEAQNNSANLNNGYAWDRVAVCALQRAAVSSVTNSSVFLGAIWNRALSPAEIKSLSDNPWQLFAA